MEDKLPKKANKTQKQILLLTTLTVVFCALIGGVLALSKIGVFDNKSKESSYDAVKPEESAEAVVLTEGELSIQDVLMQASDYSDIYSRLVSCYEDMYAENELSELEGDFFADGAEVSEDESYYSMDQVISFTEVQEYESEKGSVCKTDDTYAYMVRNDGTLCIMKLDGSTMEHMSVISEYEREMESIKDVHVNGDCLILITSFTEEIDVDAGFYRDGTMIYSYDITDRAAPVLVGKVEMDGYYMGSRMMDSGVYVYTSCYKDGFIDAEGNLLEMSNLDPTEYIPAINGNALSAEDVYVGNVLTDTGYLICASVEFASPEQTKDAKAFLSVDSEYYAGENGIYLKLKQKSQDTGNTVIVRLDFVDGMIVPARAGIVDGNIVGTQAFNEKDGMLRVIAGSSLYILDEQLRVAAKKENIASGEWIQSIRFMGDEVYLATYGGNPLVYADLSDINAVREVSTPQAKGFDGYLCAYDENQILAVSYVLNETTLDYDGIQITMFDTTDLANIQEVHSLVVQADTTPVISEVTGLFLDLEKGLIGFPTEDWDEGYMNVENYYRLYSYSAENGFQSVLETRLGGGSCWYTRGFVVGSTFYVAEQDSGNVRSYDMANGYGQTGEMYY